MLRHELVRWVKQTDWQYFGTLTSKSKLRPYSLRKAAHQISDIVAGLHGSAYRLVGNCEPTPNLPGVLHAHYLVAFEPALGLLPAAGMCGVCHALVGDRPGTNLGGRQERWDAAQKFLAGRFAAGGNRPVSPVFQQSYVYTALWKSVSRFEAVRSVTDASAYALKYALKHYDAGTDAWFV